MADTLQEWDRPVIARPIIPSTAISIDFDENDKIFKVKIALSPKYVDYMNEDLKTKISDYDEEKLPAISPAFK